MRRVLHWFWAPVRENENWAQTLVRVLGNLFRIPITLGLAAAAIAAMIYAGDSRQRRLINVEARTGIEGENSNGCTAEFPIAIEVRNNSTLTLMSMRIDVTARRPGTSTNLLNRTIRWEHIVPPQHVLGMCYRIGRDPVDSSAVYSAAAVSYSMVLRPTEDWMQRETQARRLNRFDRYVIPPCRDGLDDGGPLTPEEQERLAYLESLDHGGPLTPEEQERLTPEEQERLAYLESLDLDDGGPRRQCSAR
jgi:hypothetical protein